MTVAQQTYLPRYIHNGYLWIGLKMGLPALILYLGIFLLFAVQSFGTYRRAHDWQDRAVALCCVLASAGLLAVNLAQRSFVTTSAAASIALMWGLTETTRLRLGGIRAGISESD